MNTMQKGNWYQKVYPADKFGWHFYCKFARLGQKRADKKATSKAVRRLMADYIHGQDSFKF